MRISLVNPAGYLPADAPWLPLGAVRLATLLEDAGHDVTLFDEEAFGLADLETVLDTDVLCLTGMSHQAERIRYWIARAKDRGIRSIVGGVHATLSTDALDADVVLTGPGELVIADVVEGDSTNQIIRTSPTPEALEATPYPARRRYGWHRYAERSDGRPAIRILGAYGCPYRCRFCCNRQVSGGRIVFRSAESIGREIEENREDLGDVDVVFAMSAFTVNRRWTREVCEVMARLGTRWKATTRVDIVDREIIQAMKDSGCYALGFGVESGSDRVLEVLGKRTTSEQARDAFAICREVGLDSWAMFMSYVPGEDAVSLAATESLAKELSPPLGWTVQRYSPLPGSEFWDDLDRWGMRVGRDEIPGSFGPVGFVPHTFCTDERAA